MATPRTRIELRRGSDLALIVSAIEWFASRGIERIMLWSAEANAGAQRLFASFGFRPTMVEMTLNAGVTIRAGDRA